MKKLQISIKINQTRYPHRTRLLRYIKRFWFLERGTDGWIGLLEEAEGHLPFPKSLRAALNLLALSDAKIHAGCFYVRRLEDASIKKICPASAIQGPAQTFKL